MVEGLRDHGYVPGRNLVIECRYPEGQEDRARSFAAEFVDMKVDLIVAASTLNVRAAKQATNTVPIIMAGVMNPVGRGLVASLARPAATSRGRQKTPGRRS